MTLFQCVIRMMIRKPQVYIGLALNTAVVAAVVFAYATFVFHPQLDMLWHGEKQTITEQLLRIMFGVLMLCSLLSLLYFLSVLCRERRKQFGIFILLGMKISQLQLMLIWEILSIGSCSTIAGIFLGVLLNMSLLHLLKLNVEYFQLAFHFSEKSLYISTASCLLLFLLAALIMPLLVREQHILRFFRDGGERREGKSDLSIGILRSILSFFFLGLVIVLCWFWPIPVELTFHRYTPFIPTLLVCLVLTTLGIYFFYRQGMVMIAKFLLQKHQFSWRKSRLLWMSSITYRLRENAHFLSLFSLLLTISFISISLFPPLFSVFFSSQYDSHLNTYYYNYSKEKNVMPSIIYSLGEKGRSSPLEKQWRSLDSILTAGGLVRFVSQPLVLVHRRNTQLEYTEGYFIRARDYNEMARRSGKPFLTLGTNDAMGMDYAYANDTGSEFPYPLLKDLGIQEVQHSGTKGNTVFPRMDVPQWILGDYAYAKVSKHYKIKKVQHVNYFLPYNGTNIYIINTMIRLNKYFRGASPPTYSTHLSNGMSGGVVYAKNYEPYLWKVLAQSTAISYVIVFFVFMIAADGFLLSRIYTDIEGQRQQFLNLLRVGFSVRDVRRSITNQMAFIFFSPLLLSTIFTASALRYGCRYLLKYPILGEEIEFPDWSSLVGVIAVALGVHFAMFFLTRAWVWRNIQGQWNSTRGGVP
ncbi:FtsX-like permease family protein [Pasteuria penetrans]|uniref:FtsX-like permease family protein n=1 Tax=Pasteuria penetrans TaxID=86005 RepID=UPI001CAA46D2|nr:FtsX-like permease family protein [Pasteuria penetrans]